MTDLIYRGVSYCKSDSVLAEKISSVHAKTQAPIYCYRGVKYLKTTLPLKPKAHHKIIYRGFRPAENATITKNNFLHGHFDHCAVAM